MEADASTAEGTLRRERTLKVVLVLVRLLFTAGAYPLIGLLLHPVESDTGDTMMLSLYVAPRSLLAHRSAEPIGAAGDHERRLQRLQEILDELAALTDWKKQ
jgi:hypothetical protein